MEIFENLTETPTKAKLTYLQADSPASLFQKQENEKEIPTADIYGIQCCKQLIRLSRLGLWQKTFSDLLLLNGGWYSQKSKLTWKMKVTKSNRLLFHLAASTHHIKEIEYGLLPTPKAWDAKMWMPRTSGRSPIKSTHLKTRVFFILQKNGVILKPFLLPPSFLEMMMGYPIGWTEI